VKTIRGDKSMFSETLARVQGAPFAPPLVVCNDEHRFLVAEESNRPANAPFLMMLVQRRPMAGARRCG